MPPSNDLSSRMRLTRWIVLQKARRHGINPLRLLVGTQFQVLFHSPPGVLFTFPSLYLFTIDRISYLALAGGPAGFKQGFSCPVLLENSYYKVRVAFAYLAITVSGVFFQTLLLATQFSYFTHQ
jgi:hypothetical protein